MSHLDTITKRIRQVDPWGMLSPLELAIDLGPHLSVTPFFVPEEALENFLVYDLSYAGWARERIASAIAERFKL